MLKILSDADAIAQEWVTEMRLTHVLDKIPAPHGPEQTKAIIDAMIDDVVREAANEFVDSKEARRAIGKRAAQLYGYRMRESLRTTA